MESSDVVAGDQGVAADYNLLREDVVRTGGDHATTGGAANVQTLAIASSYDSYIEGDLLKWKAGFSNTGSMTLNVNTINAKDVKKYVGPLKVDVALGDVISGHEYVSIYDGTDIVIINASDNRYFEYVTAGETIAPNDLVYYDKTDDEWKLADANNTSKVRASAIAVTAGTNGNKFFIQTGGIFTAASGTPFVAEVVNYLSDTPGEAIGLPSVTTSVPLGYASSTTEILLTFGMKMAAGAGSSQSGDGTYNETITPGFRAEHLILIGNAKANVGHEQKGEIHYIGGVGAYGFAYTDSQSTDSGAITNVLDRLDTGDRATLSAETFTDTTFDIRSVIVNGGSTDSIRWIQFGN